MASTSSVGQRWLRAPLVLFLVLASGLHAVAQPTPQSPIGDVPEADFLFGQPRGSLSIRASLLVPREGSDLFDFVQDQLTIDQGAFRSPAFATELAVAVTPRLDILAGFDIARRTIASEYRDLIGNDQLPIEQQSQLRQNSLTAGVRFALAPRGRTVGRYAWIPSRIQPYVGAGGGLIFWQFRQTGEFVDFQDFRIFNDTFTSKGTAPSAHILGGVDVPIYKRLQLTTEGRYVWAHGDLEEDFVGFDPIDLSGFKLSAGINFVF